MEMEFGEKTMTSRMIDGPKPKSGSKNKLRTMPRPTRVGSFRKRYQETEARYLDLVDHLPVGVYRTTPDGRFIEANPALAHILGFESAEELKDLNVKDFYVRRKDRASHLRKLDRSITFFTEFQLRRRNGTTIWGRDYPRAVKGPSGCIEHYDGILVDITREKQAEQALKNAIQEREKSNLERKKMIRKLESISLTDDLTGLNNRRGFFTFAQQYLQVAARKKTPLFLLFLDVDNMKRINDSYGHHMGDAALIRMANILRKTFRLSDIKGRMGGDEFGVFPVGSSLASVEAGLGRLKKAIAVFNAGKRSPFKLSISSGIACYDPEYPSTIAELLVRADKLMYEQKLSKQR
jgi:diguanylate cyclase (GGDEF)-like protein/PAS domain S-box-containing protein